MAAAPEGRTAGLGDRISVPGERAGLQNDDVAPSVGGWVLPLTEAGNTTESKYMKRKRKNEFLRDRFSGNVIPMAAPSEYGAKRERVEEQTVWGQEDDEFGFRAIEFEALS